MEYFDKEDEVILRVIVTAKNGLKQWTVNTPDSIQ
jgi:hypothetical protein